MIGQSFEKITTHSKNIIYIHTECAYGNEPIIHIKPKQNKIKLEGAIDENKM